MRISVVVTAHRGRPPEDVLLTASIADRLGYPELWVGEGTTWDAFALAGAIAMTTDRIPMTVGPLAVSVRDPATVVRGAASVAVLGRRPIGVALGTSSARIVEGLHGRSHAQAATVLAENTRAVGALLRGSGVIAGAGREGDASPRLPPPGGPLTVAAFGPRAIAVAAEHAERMALDMVAPEQVRRLRSQLDAAAKRVGRPPPRLAAWLPAAVDPDTEALRQIARSVAGYLAVPGYKEMFAAAGFDEAVRLARSGVGTDDLLQAMPEDAVATVALVGGVADVRTRLQAYADAGLDEVALVPATSGDAAGKRTMTALADLLPRP